MSNPSHGRSSRNADPGMAGVLDLPDEERTLVTWLMRQQQVSLSQISRYLEQSDDATQRFLDDLVEREYVTRRVTPEGVRYSARPAARSRKTAMPPDVWQTLEGLGRGRRGQP